MRGSSSGTLQVVAVNKLNSQHLQLRMLNLMHSNIAESMVGMAADTLALV